MKETKKTWKEVSHTRTVEKEIKWDLFDFFFQTEKWKSHMGKSRCMRQEIYFADSPTHSTPKKMFFGGGVRTLVLSHISAAFI